jgi:hypothetical protein
MFQQGGPLYFQNKVYIKGPKPEVVAKTMRRPHNNRMVIIGINHHSFRCQRKTNSSPAIEKFDIIERINNFIAISHFLTI